MSSAYGTIRAMENLSEPLRLGIALLLGGVIGLEREINEKKQIGNNTPTAIVGLRSFALTSGLGALVGIVAGSNGILAGVIAAAFTLLLLIFYFVDSKATHDYGITTEIGLLYAFTIGILIVGNILPISIIIALTVVVILLLARKDKIKGVVDSIQRREINAFISYAIIALVVLPFLPDQTYSIADLPNSQRFFEALGGNAEKLTQIALFNPYKLWFVVAIITGVDIFGYMLERTIGQKKGWLLTSIAGGFISSTATTQSIAQQSREVKTHGHLLASAIFANVASFFQVGILIAAFNPILLFNLLPLFLAIIVTGLATGVFFLLRAKKEHGQQVALQQGEIFNIIPALKFAGIYMLVIFLSKIGLEFFGSSGFIASSAIAALAGIDAVLINTAQLAGKAVSYELAAWTFVLVNAVNLGGKTVYSFVQGEKTFAFRFGLSMGLIVFASVAALLFI